LLFENSPGALKELDKYHRRYLPIISQVPLPYEKGIFVLPEDEGYAKKLLLELLHLQQCEAQRNPLTGLPGNEAIKEEIKNRILQDDEAWLVYADLNNFKTYNDHYGVSRGDNLIANLGSIIQECVPGNFIGHIGGDDFIFLIDKGSTTTLDTICRLFDQSLVYYYSEADLARGEITGTDRFDRVRELGLAHVAMAVMTKRYKDSGELTYAAALLKGIVKERSKNEGRSLWLWDRDYDILHRDSLIKILKSSDRLTKRTAIEVLGEIADEINIDLFISLLGDRDFLIRKSAVYALGRIGKDEFMPYLLSALNDVSAHVRMRAAEALANFHSPEVYGALIKALHDKNRYVKEAAIQSLGRLRVKAVLPELLLVKEAKLIPIVLFALGEIGDARALPFIKGVIEERGFSRYAIDALARLGGEGSLTILLDLLTRQRKTNNNAILRAIYHLSKIPQLKSVIKEKKELLHQALLSESPYYPIMILYELGDDESDQKIKGFLRDKNAYLRYAAVLYLGNNPKNLNILYEILNRESSALVRRAVITSISKMGKVGLPLLRKALKDKDDRIRKASARAILKMLF